MTKKAKAILKQAMELSADERIDLPDLHFASLSDAKRTEIELAWVQEGERRIDDLAAGRGKLVPADEVFREAKEKLKPQPPR
jgi:putative addiction module component (TIGR02574 family)